MRLALPSISNYTAVMTCLTRAPHAQNITPVTQTFVFSLAQDTVFSCVVTALFLRPIFKVLGEVGNVGGVRSAGEISLEKTKWLTLLGAGLAVLSSTAMYINYGLFIVLGDYGKPFYANPYLNLFVFGINLDSILNDVGMLLACGIIKKLACETAFLRSSTSVTIKVEPAMSIMPAFDSNAHDNESKHNDDIDDDTINGSFGNPLAEERISPGVARIQL
jgi:hypothetical protein